MHLSLHLMTPGHQRRRAGQTVCGRTVRAVHTTDSVTTLLTIGQPCQQCLEWLVEQGQLASRRLESLNEQGEHAQ